MKRVLVLIKSLSRGGAQQLLVDGLRHRDRRRFDYEVAYLLPGFDALVPALEQSELPVTCLGHHRTGGWLRALRGLIDARSIDLVHIHSPYVAAGARIAIPARRAPLVYTEHNAWDCYHPATRWANALTLVRSAHVFAVSHSVREAMHARLIPWLTRVPPVEVLYHGIDPSGVAAAAGAVALRAELGVPADAPLVATVAEFRAEKGHRHLLRAAAIVRRTIPEARFVLVGEGAELEPCRRLAGELGLNGTVIFAGTRTDGPAIGAAADAFTLASVHEGIPVALLEAMARRCPPVVTDAGGMPEVVRDEHDGLVARAGDPDALARTLIRMLSDAPLRRRLGEGAAARAKAFDIRPAVARMEAVYAGLLG